MNTNYYGFLIEKYGKWKINKKERVLILSQEGISYYPVPDDKELYQKLLSFKNEVKNGKKNDQELLQGANLTNDMTKFPKSKRKGEISFKNYDIKNHYENRLTIYDITVEEDKRKDKNKEWDCIISSSEYDLMTKIRREFENNKNKNEKDENKGQRKAEESQNNKITSQNNQFTNYRFLLSLEKLYQILWDEYYKEKNSSSKKPGKLAELELSIQIVVNEFTKYCERLAQVILSYLKPETFSDRGGTKIIPILFPILTESETQDHYLIYYFFGVTITMTWNVISYNSKTNQHAENTSQMNNTQITNNRKESKGVNSSGNIGSQNMGGNGNDEGTKILYGTWDTLKANFKQIDFFQNIGLDNINDKSKALRVPLTCLIDYCGFRFLCECDLAGKTKNNETQKTDTKRDIDECKPEFYQKCLNLFCELFFCNDSKKDGTFQKNDDNYGSNRSFMDNNKNGQEQEKTPYEKLFDIMNDYFSKQENNGENNVEQKSGPQNKTIFFQTQLKKTQQDKGDQSNTISVDYFNINYYDFNNLREYPRQSTQDNELLFFNKKTFFRPELISSSKGKDNNFGDQNFAHRNDKDGLENNKTSDEQNQNKLGAIKEKYLNIFNNSLNSFYFKIYDSETMDKLFHSHGINLISLGYIAEKSESPYIREFCINEMIARTCKKLIFHILAEDRMFPILNILVGKDQASSTSSPPPFKSYLLPYKYQKLYNKYENKNETKEDSTTSWSYFKHLKEMNFHLNSPTFEEYKFFLSLWGLNQTNQQKNNDETTRNEILNINSVDDKKNPKLMNENEGHNQNKKSTNIIADDHIKRSKELIAKFLNVLFNKTKEKIKIKGVYKNHKELWKFIREEVENYYEIDLKEILIFCKLNCMSLPPFLDALEYHTGIKLDWGKVKDDKNKVEPEVINTKNNETLKIQNYYPENKTNNYTNRHILNITWKAEDVLEIVPKTKTFSFNFFLSNKREKNVEYICNYSQFIINRNLSHVEDFDKLMLLRFFYEKINRSNNFSLWYIIYFNQLKYDFLESAKENNIKIEQDRESSHSDSKKDEKANKNLVYNKNNECIDLYKYIYEELKKSEQNNKNTRYDLTGLLFNEDSNGEEEITNNKAISCSLYMQKKFSRLGYIMINLTKEIQAIVETNLDLSTDENNPNPNERGQGLLPSGTIPNISGNNELSTSTKRQLRRGEENSKDNYPEVKRIDGDLVFHAETILRFDPPLQYETQALELIENFYIQEHPYYCDIKELCGKELLKRWKASHKNSKQLEEFIEKYFKEAINAGLKCLPSTNIYLANISLDVGTFYAARNDYLNAVEIFKCAYSPFKNNSQYFQKDYHMFLKRFIKYNIKLGDFKYALELGAILLDENQNFRNEKDGKASEYLSKNLHMERIKYNLALIALKVKDYDKGLRHCHSIFENKEQISTTNNDSSSNPNNPKRRKTEYINWQRGKEDDYPGKNLPDKDYESKLEDQEYHIKLKLYMKMIIRSLKDENKKVYLQAILRFYDSAEEKQSLREEKKDLKEIQLALQGNGNLYEYFKGKILMALKIKNQTKENPTDKSQMKEKEQQNSDYEIFKKLFRYFENDNVFYTFNRRTSKNEFNQRDYKKKEVDDYDGKKIKVTEKDSEDDGRADDPEDDNQDEENSDDAGGYSPRNNFFG